MKTFFRAISSALLVTFTSLTMQPLQAAIQMKRAQQKTAPAPKRADEQYADVLDKIEEQTKKARSNRGHGKPSKAEAKAIRALKRQLDALDAAVEAEFDATAKHLEDKKLAQVIKDRHAEAVQTYRNTRTQFATLTAALDKADDNGSDFETDAALTNLSTFFDTHSQSRARAPLDPNNLPWRTPKVTSRQPITDTKLFKTKALMSKALSTTPTADDLAETEDVQITPAIRAKAQELGNQPLAIYLWVRNNIRFTPTYGSVQGSQDTLDKLSGNAFDTASLLIALLRAANVPARYAYGTIDVPVDKVMNWVGGVSNVAAAQQVLGQGGIPNAALVSGGIVKNLRMEHVWVEAYIDYMPSRGAQHIQGDTWIPIDASYKQYTFTQGMDLTNALAFDGNAFLTGAQQGAILDQYEGWVQNVNQINIQSSLTNYQNQITAYIQSRKPDATAADVLGMEAIVPATLSVFAGVLPYKVAAYGPVYTALPDSLRHKFTYALYASAADRDNAMPPVWTYTESLPRLAGKRLTLTSTAASSDDANLIASYLPQPHSDGSPITANEVPRSIPAYAQVVPVLRLNAEIVASGAAFRLGTELAGRGGFTQNDFSGWDLTDDDTLLAGQPCALAVSGQGIGKVQLDELSNRLELTRQSLLTRDAASISRDSLSTDLLTAAAWRYFASTQLHGAIMQRLAKVVEVPSLSYGLVHAAAQPIKLYGVVTTGIAFPGIGLDLGHMRLISWSIAGQTEDWIRYNQLRGQFASAMEHETASRASEANSSDAPKPAVSAIKALQVAAAQGQRIYVVNQQNVDSILNQLSHSQSVLDDVSNSAHAGKSITISQRDVEIGTWTGAGYVVSDPQTGAAGYLIEGGARGGFSDDSSTSFSLSAASNSSGSKDPEGDKAILSLLIDLFSSLLVPAFGHIGAAIKEAISYVLNIAQMFEKCSGVQLAFLSYALAVISIASILFVGLLALPLLISVLLGVLINALISAIFADIFVPIICKPK